jgi:hypothetical protein
MDEQPANLINLVPVSLSGPDDVSRQAACSVKKNERGMAAINQSKYRVDAIAVVNSSCM